MLKKYKLAFDVWGLLLFLIIMIPNFIWFAIPAPNDVLRVDSVTEILDTIASICQVVMAISLYIFVNIKSPKFCITPRIVFVIICCLLYFVSWIIYYTGMANVIIILGLTIFPCLAFIIFAICHLIYGVVNFLI